MKKNRIKKVVFAMGTCCFMGISSLITYATETEIEMEVEPQTEVLSAIITHQHTGSSGSGGGCYGQKHTQSETTYCHKPLTKVSWDKLVCSGGHTLTNTVSGGWDTWPIPGSCNIATGTTTKTYYTANCGRTGEVLASLFVEKSNTEWVKELTLSATYEVADGVVLLENPVLFKGNGQEEEAMEFLVTENGTYTCELQVVGEDNNAKTQVVTYEVANIDRTPPTILSVTYDQSLFLAEIEVVVEAEDLQEDGSAGIGLTETPYSYDGGKTWVADNTFIIEKNGSYTIMVKDSFDNIASKEIEISTLDTMGPTVSTIIQETLDTEYNSVKVLVYVEDVQEDGSEGVGLGELPYSFDGGKTWQALEYYYYHGNGTYAIVIRDAKGNETKTSVSIKQFPTVSKPSQPSTTPTPVTPVIPVEDEEVTEELQEEFFEEEIEEGLQEKNMEYEENEDEEDEEISVLGIIEPDGTETVVVHYPQTIRYDAPEELVVEELEDESQKAENEALIQQKRLEEMKKIVVISTTAVVTMSGICAFIYCFLFMTIVCSKTNENRKRFLGIAKIKRGEKMEIHIPNWVYERSTSHILVISINPFLAHKYALDPVIVYVDGKEYLYSIEPVLQVEVSLM